MKGFAYWAVVFLFFLISCSGKVDEIYRGMETKEETSPAEEMQFDEDQLWSSLDFGLGRYALILDNNGTGYEDVKSQSGILHRFAGFEVFAYVRPDAEDMRNAIDAFLALASREPEASFFIFYSGSCVQVGSSFYLVPADVDEADAGYVAANGYEISGILKALDGKDVFFALDITNPVQYFLPDDLICHPYILSIRPEGSSLFKLVLFDELACGYRPVMDVFSEVAKRISMISEGDWECEVGGGYSPFIFADADVLERMAALLENAASTISPSDSDASDDIGRRIGLMKSKAAEAECASSAASEDAAKLIRTARNNRIAAGVSAGAAYDASQALEKLSGKLELLDDYCASFVDGMELLVDPYMNHFAVKRDVLLNRPYEKDEQTLRKEPKTLEIRYRHDETSALISQYEEEIASELDAGYKDFATKAEDMLVDVVFEKIALESRFFVISTQGGRYYLDIGPYDAVKDGWILMIRGLDDDCLEMDVFLPYQKLSALAVWYGFQEDEAISSLDDLFSRDSDLLRVEMIYRISCETSDELRVIPVDLMVYDNVFDTALLAFSELELDGMLPNSTVELPPFEFISLDMPPLFFPNVSVPGKLAPGPAGGWIIYDCDADNQHGNYDNLVSSECGWRYLEVAPAYVVAGEDGFASLASDEDSMVPGCQFSSEIGRYILFPPTSTHVGAGFSNTELLASMGVEAALLCGSLEAGGFSDWFIPSKGELELAAAVIDLDDDVWTSSIIDHEVVWTSGGGSLWSGEGKILPMRVFK